MNWDLKRENGSLSEPASLIEFRVFRVSAFLPGDISLQVSALDKSKITMSSSTSIALTCIFSVQPLCRIISLKVWFLYAKVRVFAGLRIASGSSSAALWIATTFLARSYKIRIALGLPRVFTTERLILILLGRENEYQVWRYSN